MSAGPQRILIDGYNVIYADDALRKIAVKDMERARCEFLARLRGYIGEKSLHVTVVFDGRGGLTDSETLVPGKLDVVFSAGRETADDVIVAMVADSPNPRAFLVVTSDRTHIRPAVAALGCRSVGAKTFLDRLSPRRRTARGRGGTGGAPGEGSDKPEPGSEDRDFWLDLFEDDAGRGE